MADPDAARVYLSVAANLNPERNIAAALELLRSRVTIEALSPFYRTAAIDRPEQPDYLNGVARVRTELEPAALKAEVLRPIEAELGRVRGSDPYAARTIDLDILLHGEKTVCNGEMTIPDPDIVARPFLGAGLLELEPAIVLPGDSEPLAARVDAKGLADLLEDRACTQRLKEKFTP